MPSFAASGLTDVGIIAVWGPWPPRAPNSPHGSRREIHGTQPMSVAGWPSFLETCPLGNGAGDDLAPTRLRRPSDAEAEMPRLGSPASTGISQSPSSTHPSSKAGGPRALTQSTTVPCGVRGGSAHRRDADRVIRAGDRHDSTPVQLPTLTRCSHFVRVPDSHVRKLHLPTISSPQH